MDGMQSRSVAFAGVILAAGESSRMGRDKALLPWPPAANDTPSKDTILSAAIRSLSLTTDFVIVVAGKNEPILAPIAYANGASIAVNPDPGRGQFSSLKVGLREVLNHGRDATIITLVDRPPAALSTIQTLHDAFTAAPANVWAIVPEFAGKHGHPYVAGREMIEVFLRTATTGNAQDVLHLHEPHIQYIAVNDPNVTLNINLPADYEALVQK